MDSIFWWPSNIAFDFVWISYRVQGSPFSFSLILGNQTKLGRGVDEGNRSCWYGGYLGQAPCCLRSKTAPNWGRCEGVPCRDATICGPTEVTHSLVIFYRTSSLKRLDTVKVRIHGKAAKNKLSEWKNKLLACLLLLLLYVLLLLLLHSRPAAATLILLVVGSSTVTNVVLSRDDSRKPKFCRPWWP